MSINRVKVGVQLADGREWPDLTINNHALVEWDLTRGKNGWPPFKDAPMLWLTFLAWQQLVDQGEYPRTVDNPSGPKAKPLPSFGQFREHDCVAIADESADELNEPTPVDPTNEAAEHGPVSPSQQPQASTPAGYTEPTTAS